MSLRFGPCLLLSQCLGFHLHISCILHKQDVPEGAKKRQIPLFLFPVLASVQFHSYFPGCENCYVKSLTFHIVTPYILVYIWVIRARCLAHDSLQKLRKNIQSRSTVYLQITGLSAVSCSADLMLVLACLDL